MEQVIYYIVSIILQLVNLMITLVDKMTKK
ncbi:hypothetical protein M2277_004956 [Paenibacillus sp. LBL]|nr:hypothetical protein [Paenibacillus sp. LBL]